MTVMFHLMPPTPVIEYGVSRSALVEQIVWFSLRGMGLKEEAIQRVYQPKTVAQFLNGSAAAPRPMAKRSKNGAIRGKQYE
jgi:hypothetical protein